MNRPLYLVCFVSPIEVPGELDPLSLMPTGMHVNKTKFERAKFEKFTRSYRPVGIELNSTQAIEVDSVVRVVSDRPGSVSI